jgi:RNA polymerase-binding transcription factor DksA
MASPQFQRLMAIQQKGMLDGVYAPLFKALNLSPQQLEQFKNLMVQRQQAAMDAVQAAREQGINPRSDPAAFQQAVAQAQATVDSQIQATLGDAGYAQYQQYQATLPQRNTVNQLEQSLSYTATPLTGDQASQLVQILAQAAPSPGSASGQGNPMAALFPGGGPMGGGGAGITEQAVTLAQGVLSAPQLQALQQLQQQQLVRQQMQQLMRAGRGGG